MQDLIASTNEVDASGNPKLADIGTHLKTIVKQYFDRADVKYIDPTYMIRAIATTSPDRVYCKVLAHNAVHAAFGGFTGTHLLPTNTCVILQLCVLPVEVLHAFLTPMT